MIESVNVHEDIKLGLPTREEYIANYISTIRMLAKHGVKVIVYNFMPVFDWLRTDLARLILRTAATACILMNGISGKWGRWRLSARLRRIATASRCPVGSRSAWRC